MTGMDREKKRLETALTLACVIIIFQLLVIKWDVSAAAYLGLCPCVHERIVTSRMMHRACCLSKIGQAKNQ
jgi:hypothetical protein